MLRHRTRDRKFRRPDHSRKLTELTKAGPGGLKRAFAPLSAYVLLQPFLAFLIRPPISYSSLGYCERAALAQTIRDCSLRTVLMERIPRRRRRPALSCIECRRRKIRCDRGQPCQHCVSAKLQCAYRFYREPREHTTIAQQPLSPSTEGPSPVSLFPQRATPTRQVDDPLSLQFTSAPAAEQLGSSRLSANGKNGENTPASSHDEEARIHDLLLRVQRLEDSSASNPLRSLSETGRTILARQSGLQNSQVILNKTRILRWSHWMGTAPEV